MWFANSASFSIPLQLLLSSTALGLVLPYQNEHPLLTSIPKVRGHSQESAVGLLQSDDVESSGYRIPTVRESAVQARRILQLESIGTLSTVFPASSGSSNDDERAAENRPSGLGGFPIGLMDYFSACEEDSHPGDPTILEITIATSFKNVASGSNITMSLRWHPPYDPSSYAAASSGGDSRDSDSDSSSSSSGGSGNVLHYSEAALPRFALVGYLEDLTAREVRAQGVGDCFLRQHPDSHLWFPGNQIHTSKWVRLVVQEVYWIGGFGDRAYIGWIPLEDWQGVTQKEIDDIRLPGELP